MAYIFAYVIFLLYLRPATLRGNPSKVQPQYPATDNYFAKTTNYASRFRFFAEIFVQLKKKQYLCSEF